MLKLLHVDKKFGDHVVLRDISCRIDQGITLLTGRNGSGKSTFLRLLAGLYRPTSGIIQNDFPRLEVGFLDHDSFFYNDLTALENLAFWEKMQSRKPNRDDLEAMLRHMGLQRAADRRVRTFSRGMVQRLSLARLLLQKPKLWLLDEPCTGLDTASREQFYAEILAAARSGSTVIWITHDLDAERRYADSLLELSGGKLLAHSSVFHAAEAMAT
ncbi:MAG: ABC transporter ATP-binding protein [Desulfovibrionaceae bacterium]|nr:ABC transporter ATP-binding protein [Desulfovibrionaceae bacterium]